MILAERLGVSQPAVSPFLSGEHGSTFDTVADYLRALHLQARIEISEVPEGAPPLVVEKTKSVA
jgi:predicted transcriptional regulator